jgi:hypothetical protein
MSIYFKYLDYPSLPKDLYQEVYKSVNLNPNHFTFLKAPYYKIHEATRPLRNFITSIIPESNKKVISVQVLKGRIPIHTDTGRTSAFNYIIEPGGDNVYTCFYKNKNLIEFEYHNIESHRWHFLDVTTLHNVINIQKDSLRIAITISF